MLALYDYKCKTCNEIHVINHSVTESPKIPCEKCGQVLAKVFSAPALNFPGSGWGSDR